MFWVFTLRTATGPGPGGKLCVEGGPVFTVRLPTCVARPAATLVCCRSAAIRSARAVSAGMSRSSWISDWDCICRLEYREGLGVPVGFGVCVDELPSPPSLGGEVLAWASIRTPALGEKNHRAEDRPAPITNVTKGIF